MTEHEKKYAVALAGMLYDMGGFVLAAGESQTLNSREAAKVFFEQHIAKKKCVIPVADYVRDILSATDGEKIQPLLQSEQIYLESEGVDTRGIAGLKIMPLYSVFTRINLNEKNKTGIDKEYFYKPHKLDIKNVFPISFDEFDENEFKSDLSALYDGFVGELKFLPDNEIAAFVDSLLYLFEKYFVYVSDNAIEKSDISFYDYVKTVAALSICKEFSDSAHEPFLIISADISGIQKFIYSEKESKSKRLRGRSFYLSLLSEMFSEYLLQKFDLPRTNLLMNGGGHFVMIVPNNEENVRILNAEKKEIEKWFYNNYKGELNLIMASVAADDELYQNFPKWYDKISGLLIKAKKQKSAEYLFEVFNYELDKADYSEYYNVLNKKEEIDRDKTEYEQNLEILDSLFKQIGSVLPKTKYLIKITSDDYEKIIELTNKTDDLAQLPFGKFGVNYIFVKNPTNFIARNKNFAFDSIRIMKINDTEIYSEEFKRDLKIIENSDSPYSVGFTLIGHYLPKDEDGSVWEFEKIASSDKEEADEVEEESYKYKLLGTLRMDVDNLGAIFSQGLERNEGESVRTLSRTVMLSRQFNLFFGGYLNEIAEKWDVYITYSGGDDLFVVASWVNAINFAINVRNEFAKFVCENSDVTISGGIYFHKHGFPIGRAAEQAGEAERKAKTENAKKTGPARSENEILKKNRVCVFDKVLYWENFNRYIEYGKQLNELVKQGDIKPSYLHFLLQQSKEIFKNTESSTPEKREKIKIDNYFGIIYKIKYYLARGARGIKGDDLERLGKNEKVTKKVELLAKLINDKEYLENLVVPASYVILKDRDKKNSKKQNKTSKGE